MTRAAAARGNGKAARTAAAQTATLGLCLILVSILLLDRPVASYVHVAMARPTWTVWLTYIADVPGPAAVVGLAGCGVAWVAGWRPGKWGRALIAACLATLAAIEAKEMLKYAFGRTWPETFVDNNPSWIGNEVYGFFPFHGGRGYAAFPSGHTTAIVAPCAVFSRHTRHLRFLCVLLPGLVVLGLIGADYHFVSDCMAGALLATAIGVSVDTCIRAPGA